MGYRILRKLGAGGMGAVFVAVQEGLDREVALKQLPFDDPDLVARFRREMRIISQLDHPNVVRVYDWGEMEGHLFYTMELVDGSSLADVRGSDFAHACALISQAADALAYLHERELVHRDIKPANFVVDRSGRLLLIDFGLARAKENTALTAAGALVGTLRYISPEGAAQRPIEAPADVYALACTAHELIAGRPAFPGAAIATLIASILAPERPTLAGTPGVPAWFVELQTRALALDPGQRPTAAEYRDALRAHVGTGLLPVIGAGGGEVAAEPTPVPAARARPAEKARRGGAAQAAGPKAAPAAPAPARAPDRRVSFGAVAVALVVGAIGGATVARWTDARVAPVVAPIASPAAPAPAKPAPQAVVGAPVTDPEIKSLREWTARTFAVHPSDATVLVDYEVEVPFERPLLIDVSVRRWDSKDVLASREHVFRGHAEFQHEFEGLAPDTDHGLRVALRDGPVLIDDYRFRTRPASFGAEVKTRISQLADPAHVGEAVDFFIRNPDRRVLPALAPEFWKRYEARTEILIQAARVVARLRDVRTGDLLFHLARTCRGGERGAFLLAAVQARVGRAIALAYSEIHDARDPLHLEACWRAGFRLGEWTWRDVLRAMRDRPLPGEFGVELARLVPSEVVPATDRTGKEVSETSLAVICDAFVALANGVAAERLALRQRERVWSADFTADTLGAMFSREARDELLRLLAEPGRTPAEMTATLAGLQRAGPTPDVPESLVHVDNPDPAISREAISFLTAWGPAASIPVLLRATRLPDERAGLAAWGAAVRSFVMGQPGRPDVLSALYELARSPRDTSGLAAAGMALISGPDTAAQLRALLDPRLEDGRLQGLAWAFALQGAGPTRDLRLIADGRPAAVRDSVRAAVDWYEKPGPKPLPCILPAGMCAMIGVQLSAGQSADLSATGAWGLAGQPLRAVHDTTPLPGHPTGLSLTALIWNEREPIGPRPRRFVMPRDGQILFSPYPGRPRGAWLATRPPLVGFAVVTVGR